MNNLVHEFTLVYKAHSRGSFYSRKARDTVMSVRDIRKGVVGKLSMFKSFYTKDITIFFICFM